MLLAFCILPRVNGNSELIRGDAYIVLFTDLNKHLPG